jgi:hypothetical protein
MQGHFGRKLGKKIALEKRAESLADMNEIRSV